MKKTILRSLSIFLAIFFLLGAIPIGASAAEITSDFEYSILDDGTIELTRYKGGSSDVALPEEIDGKIVTKVNEFCFYNDSDYNGFDYKINSISIPKTVTSFGNIDQEYKILNRLYKLISINVDLQNGYYYSLDGVLFNKNRSKLIYYPRLKSGYEYIVPDSVTILGDSAFNQVYYLQVLKFSSNFEHIGNAAIFSCNLVEAEYPACIEQDAVLFDFCTKLKKVIINKNITLINDESFFESPNVTLYVYPDSYGLEWAKSHDFPYVIMEEPPVEKDLVDENTGIQVSGVMDAEATLNVESVENSVENAISTFDITLVKDGNIIQPDGTITISIPSEYGDCEVFWIKDDGTKVNMNAGYVDGKYVFTTDHLSIYALVRDIVPTVPEPTATDPVPSETVPEPTETIPVPTETVPEPTETIPVPTETVPEPTETVPVPTETVPVTTVTDPITTEPTATEPTTTAPVVTPDTPSNGNNGSNGSSSNTPSGNSSNTNTNTSNGAVATGDMFGIDNSILIALILAATTAMIIASKKGKDSSK